jgi:arylsulfatase A-like enzyme
LEKKGYFENSIIVLLSDHGESFYKNGSRQTLLRNYQGTPPLEFAKYLDRKTNTELEKSTGHGSDLLSPDQFHCLLAFKIYKQHQLISPAKIIKTRVALIDIAPTLESLVQPHAWPAVDGISLSNAILHPNAALPKRSFLMESGMLSNQILTFDRARQLGAELFGVHHKNAELYLRRSKIVQLDKEKLYAIIKGHWLLALYPDDKGYLPILLQLKTGQWVDDLNTDFAKSSPAEPMLAELRQFYSHKTWQLVPEAAH